MDLHLLILGLNLRGGGVHIDSPSPSIPDTVQEGRSTPNASSPRAYCPSRTNPPLFLFPSLSILILLILLRFGFPRSFWIQIYSTFFSS